MKYVITNLLTIIFFGYFILHGLSVGSNSVVSRQTSVTFPQADGDNTMLGFAAFEGGFTLESATTTCTFDDLFPVSGSVDMRMGTLSLGLDLLFDKGTSLESMGNIFGNGYKVDYSSSITALYAGSALEFYDVSFIFNGDMSWQMDGTFHGDCLVNGRGKEIVVDGSSSISVASGGTLTFKNLSLDGLKSSNLSCADNSASIVFQNCTLAFSQDFSFVSGSMLFDSDVVMSGTNQFTYSSVMSSTIATQSKLVIDKDVTFYCASAIDNRDLLYMADQTSCLYLDGCTLQSTSTGLRLTRGRLLIDNSVTLSSEGSQTSELIGFGDGNSANNLSVTLLSGAALDVHGGLHDDTA